VSAAGDRPGDAAQDHVHGDTRLAARLLGVLRLLLLPIVLVSDRLVSHPLVGSTLFDAILLGATVYSLALVALRRRGVRMAGGVEVALDLTFVAALAFSSGRAFADLRPAFFVIPLGAAVALTPRRTALVSAATIGVYLLVGAVHPADGPRQFDVIAVEGLYVAWVGLAAIVLAFLLGVRRREIERLARATGVLVAQAVDAEERAQRRVSDALHDHALQNMLIARQDLAEASAGDPGALERAERALALAVEQVRSTVRELHPYVADHLDLQAALTAIAEQQAARGGYRVTVSVDPRAEGMSDALLVSAARELLINAARHSRAAEVKVSVELDDQRLLLRVVDDGRGCTATERAEALANGHIGLAALRERLLASSGTFQIQSAPGAGMAVTCTLPHASGAHAGSAGGSGERRDIAAASSL